MPLIFRILQILCSFFFSQFCNSVSPIPSSYFQRAALEAAGGALTVVADPVAQVRLKADEARPEMVRGKHANGIRLKGLKGP